MAGGSLAVSVIARDWRHSRAAPDAARITGQINASDHHQPISRITRSAASVRKPTPAATRVLGVMWGRRPVASAAPSFGIAIQAST